MVSDGLSGFCRTSAEFCIWGGYGSDVATVESNIVKACIVSCSHLSYAIGPIAASFTGSVGYAGSLKPLRRV